MVEAPPLGGGGGAWTSEVESSAPCRSCPVESVEDVELAELDCMAAMSACSCCSALLLVTLDVDMLLAFEG
jgi:hypothetical protein